MDWPYIPNPCPDTYAPIDLKIAITPIKDERGEIVLLDKGKWGAYCLPLWPYAKLEYYRPDDSSNFWYFESKKEGDFRGKYAYKYPRAITDSISKEVRECKAFSYVHFIETDSPQILSEYDLIISGTLRKTLVRQYLITYGLMPLGIFLWINGLPQKFVYFELELTLTLKENHNGELLWSKTLRGERSVSVGLYYNEDIGADPSSVFAELLRSEMKKELPQLIKAIEDWTKGR